VTERQLMSRIPLSEADKHAINALDGATRAELERAMLASPTYQRTAVRELVRVLESMPHIVADPDKPTDG